jgi:hypothetical protein
VPLDIFSPKSAWKVRDGLRCLASRYLGPSIDRRYLIPAILIPMLRILDTMFVKWDIPAVAEIVGSEFDILSKLLEFTRSVTNTINLENVDWRVPQARIFISAEGHKSFH